MANRTASESTVTNINRSEGRCPNGIFDSWVRWDRGLDPARNSSAAVAIAAAVVAVIWKISAIFSHCWSNIVQNSLKSIKNRANVVQKSPKSRQKSPKSRQKSPKSHQKSHKSRPIIAQKSSKIAPKSSKNRPKYIKKYKIIYKIYK